MIIKTKHRHICITADGSNSIFIPELNEHYHSHHGAILESQHIFIDSGLKLLAERKRNINVFEMGMGTALNILSSYLFQQQHNIQVNYTSIEKYPLSETEISKLNYVELFRNQANLSEVYTTIHSSNWGEKIQLDQNFCLFKIHDDLLRYRFIDKYDLVYFDAFAPDVQMDLWSKEIFAKLYNALNENGVLVTYCVKGIVRRTLIEVGFKVEKLKGPKGGKREILRAIK